MQILEVAIGMFFGYLVLSLVVTAANEMSAAWFRRRAWMLHKGIVNLLDDDKLAARLYEHPMIRSLSSPPGLLARVPVLNRLVGETQVDEHAGEPSVCFVRARVQGQRVPELFHGAFVRESMRPRPQQIAAADVPLGRIRIEGDGRVRHGEGPLFELPALVRRNVGEASDIRGSQFAERRGEIRIQRDRLLEKLDRAFVVLVGRADAEVPRP